MRSVSPADPKDEVGCFEVSDACAVDAAVTRAREAFPAWRDAGLAKRTELLRAFRDAARAREEELTRLIAREMGKALWDARAGAPPNTEGFRMTRSCASHRRSCREWYPAH